VVPFFWTLFKDLTGGAIPLYLGYVTRLLQLNRGQVAQGRMDALLIVNVFYELADLIHGFSEALIVR
jgi:hypothetical protein